MRLGGAGNCAGNFYGPHLMEGLAFVVLGARGTARVTGATRHLVEGPSFRGAGNGAERAVASAISSAVTAAPTGTP